MGHWVRKRSLPVRVLVYVALATLAFVLAAGVGAVAALAMRGDVVGLLEAEQSRPTGDQDAAASGVANGGADPKSAEGADSGENAGETTFVHTATDANSRGDYTYLDHPRVNGDPDAVVLAAPVPGRDGQADSSAYGHNVGVWYEPERERWAVFNQDLAAVPAGSAFEVDVPPADQGFVHRAEPADTFGNVTYLDEPLLDGKPDADVSVTQNWNPGGGEGVYNDHPVGVLYDEDEQKWAVYNRDGARIPDGSAFNLAVSESEQSAR